MFINGHGGNDVPGRQVVFELRQQHRTRKDLLFLFGTYWLLGGKSEMDARLEQSQMGHACEWETSMMLRLAPHLVGDYRNAPVVPFGNPFEPAVRGWVMGDRSKPGHIGSPHLASPEKGEYLFEQFTKDVSGLLQRVVEWDGESWDG